MKKFASAIVFLILSWASINAMAAENTQNSNGFYVGATIDSTNSEISSGYRHQNDESGFIMGGTANTDENHYSKGVVIGIKPESLDN